MNFLTSKKTYVMMVFVMVLVLALSACGGTATPAPTQDTAMIQTQAAQTVVADMALTESASESAPAPTQAPTQAPPPGPTPDPNIPVAVVPTAVPGEPSAVANYNTAIFSGPGENYVVYGAFLGGQTAVVTGKSEDGLWWAISVPVSWDGNGWVSAGWVTVSGAEGVPVLPTPPVPATVELVPPEPSDPQATVIANAYVRSGPAVNYPAYGIAQAGGSARVIGVSEDGLWWVVRLDPEYVGAGYGWVEAQYTEAINVDGVQVIENPDTYTSVPSTPPAEGVPSATAIEYVNVRTGPGTNYPVLGVAAPGASAEVSGKSADGAWWQVVIPTQYSSSGTGWVSADYVVTTNTDAVPVVDAPPAPPTVETTPPPTSATGCVLVAQSPADGTAYPAGSSFSGTWMLQNTGAEEWNAGEVDVRYVGAAANIPLHQGSDIYDLATNVPSGGTYNFTVTMIAPFDTGTYGELWEVAKGSQVYCQFYMFITVP